MKQDHDKTTRAQEARVSLLFVLLLGGNLALPFGAWAQDTAATKTAAPAGAVVTEKAGPEAKPGQSGVLPVITVEKGRYGTYVSIRSESIPGLVLDMWCYELGPGEPISHEKEGNTMVLVHQPQR